MGRLSAHNIKSYIKEYDIVNFIETGTWDGTGGSRFAASCGFKNMYSCEIDENKYNLAVKNLSDVDIELHLKPSYEFFNEILPVSGNTLFWLDAHYPEIETATDDDGYQKKYSYDIRLPLESELRIIKEKQDLTNSVIITDDLRCYIDGPFNAGNFNKEYYNNLGHGHEDGINFVYELLGETHDIKKDYRDQGYLIITPKIKNHE